MGGPTAEEEQGRQGRLVARIARAHLVRLRRNHPGHGDPLRMMHSRTAEYAADAFAKSIGAGADLASALEKLEASHATVKRDEKTLGLASNAFAASYIDNPPERDSWLLTMGGWLRTHPRNQDRIERLLA